MSIFEGRKLRNVLNEHIADMHALYHETETPWVVGYSGGKDSTAVLQLVWEMLARQPPENRFKRVDVISTDTLVENPIVSLWVTKCLQRINAAARECGLPIYAHKLTPALEDTFWVNLIGRGYAAPRHKFRWCTSRLKIKPSTRFIQNIIDEHGEAVVVLGMRKAESAARAKIMERHESLRTRDNFSPNAAQPDSWLYTPIENWTDDNVWVYLMQFPSPWGNNRELLTMYQGATEGGECPLVIGEGTPSCGDSRFGCWVCTMVAQDRSMKAMIQNDAEKEWMMPLLQLRNELDPPNTPDTDRHIRDFRRSHGGIQIYKGRPVPGPYTQGARIEWLQKVLRAELKVRELGPPEIGDLRLITMEELHEIRRIWVEEKHEIEDVLPEFYERETGYPFPGKPANAIVQAQMQRLVDVCDDDMRYPMIRELLSLARSFARPGDRKTLEKRIAKTFVKYGHVDAETAIADAVQAARDRDDAEMQKAFTGE